MYEIILPLILSILTILGVSQLFKRTKSKTPVIQDFKSIDDLRKEIDDNQQERKEKKFLEELQNWEYGDQIVTRISNPKLGILKEVSLISERKGVLLEKIPTVANVHNYQVTSTINRNKIYFVPFKDVITNISFLNRKKKYSCEPNDINTEELLNQSKDTLKSFK